MVSSEKNDNSQIEILKSALKNISTKLINNEIFDKNEIATEIIYYLNKYESITQIAHGDDRETLLIMVLKANIESITNNLCDLILKNSIDTINHQDGLGNTALMYAAMVNNIYFLEKIIPRIKRHSFDPGKKNKEEQTVCMIAASKNHEKFLKKMFLEFNISIEDQEKSLLLAVASRATASVNFLLSKGVNPFKKDDQGNTPLMLAHSNHDYETASLLRKQYLISRGIFTTACVGKSLEETAQTYQEGKIKVCLKVSGYLIKTTMYYLHNVVSMKNSITFPFSKAINEFIPHIIETAVVNTEREKHVMNLFYGESNNPNNTSINQNTLNIGISRVRTPRLNSGSTASTEDLSQSRFRGTALSTRSSGYQTQYTSSVSGDNNIEHSTPYLLETTEQDQENFNDPGGLNEGRLINSLRRQETASTQSAGTSSRSSIPRLRNSSTTEASVQLSHTLSGFNLTNAQASSSSNHQWQHQDGTSESESLSRINHDS